MINTVIPSPGLKKSMNPRLPGRTTRVLVPEPTGVRKGQEAATQMATAMDAGLISRAKAMGIKSGVTSRAVDVFIMILVSRQVRIKMKKRVEIPTIILPVVRVSSISHRWSFITIIKGLSRMESYPIIVRSSSLNTRMAPVKQMMLIRIPAGSESHK